MSFRIETKININSKNIFYLKNWLQINLFKKLYPRRKVCSVYYDNQNFQMYKDSIEGITPRKKIRIRHYPNKILKEFFFEEKISSVEGRFKKKKKI